MPLVQKGFYIRNEEDRPYEVAATYQMKYYLSTALVAIDLVLNPESVLVSKYERPVQYYRYHIDHLFYLIGQINDRLIPKKKSNKEQGLSLIKRNQIEMNRTNFCYEETLFPLLSNKIPRNIIEHLDSRNLSILQEVHGVGGFNVIFHDSDPKMIASITQHRDWYPYTLDLTTNTIYFYDAQASDVNKASLKIELLLLREEIEKLHKNVLYFANCIDFPF